MSNVIYNNWCKATDLEMKLADVYATTQDTEVKMALEMSARLQERLLEQVDEHWERIHKPFVTQILEKYFNPNVIDKWMEAILDEETHTYFYEYNQGEWVGDCANWVINNYSLIKI